MKTTTLLRPHMRLTVLGRHGPFPAPLCACSGYLLSAGTKSFVLDLGSGTFARLIERRPLLDMEAIIISHLHYDHMSDLFVLNYALEAKGRVVDVYAPDEPTSVFEALCASKNLIMHKIDAGTKFNIGDVSFSFSRTKHGAVCYACRVEYEGIVFSYTGDTGLCENTETLFSGAHAVLADAGCSRLDKHANTAAHLTIEDALKLFYKNSAKGLIVSHIFGGAVNTPNLSEIADKAPGVFIAEEFSSYIISKDGIIPG